MCPKTSPVLCRRFWQREVQRPSAKLKRGCILTPFSGPPPLTLSARTEPLPHFALRPSPTSSRRPHPAPGAPLSRLPPQRSFLLSRKRSGWLRRASICRLRLTLRTRKGRPSSSAPSLRPGILPDGTVSPPTAPLCLHPLPLHAALPPTPIHQRTVRKQAYVMLHWALNFPKTLRAV